MQQQQVVPVLTEGIDIQRHDLDFNDFVRRSAKREDFNKLIQHSVIIKDQQHKPIIVYLQIPDLPSVKMVEYLKRIKYPLTYRTKGLASRSRIFGYRPRESIRKDFCSSAALATQMPEEHAYICSFGATLAAAYKEYCPDTYKMHMDLTDERILKEWKIPDSPFTSGIINKNNPLKYHHDAGNISNVYSNMVCFKRECEGGYLALPEYDVGLEIADKSILLFDGQAILHGVTPFKMLSHDAYRFTIVYYTLKSMWHCKTVTEELARIRQRKNDREMRRYKRLTGELTLENDPLMQEWEDQRRRNSNV